MKRYMLDTHTLIWLVESSSKVSKTIRDELKSSNTAVFLSSASLWEIAIKLNISKLQLKLPFAKLLSDLQNTDITILHIEHEYLLGLSSLPLIHKDPFDRLIISTALAEGLTIITADANIQKYNVSWIW